VPDETVSWIDWRGNTYTVGTLVLYPRLDGRSCEMAEGHILSMTEVYRNESYKWVTIEPGEPRPAYLTWRWKNTETGEISRFGDIGYEHVQVMEPCTTEKRIRIMPTGRTSRFNGYEFSRKKWDHERKEFVETEQKPVTLTANVASVTVVTEG
jgi:hypothetical protein